MSDDEHTPDLKFVKGLPEVTTVAFIKRGRLYECGKMRNGDHRSSLAHGLIILADFYRANDAVWDEFWPTPEAASP